jgi:hypothetical protein
MAAKKKRTPKETWEAIQKQREEDEMARFAAAPIEQIDAELREAGFDPEAEGAEGAALAKRLLAKRARLAWQIGAADGQAKERARVDAFAGRFAKATRAELLAELAALRVDPRLGGRAAVMFRNHEPKEATDDELREMLEELLALAERKE